MTGAGGGGGCGYGGGALCGGETNLEGGDPLKLFGGVLVVV